jgi:glyoxylase-like metal-dependent hydrolase (beta-lactamase superfamily II)
MNDNPTVHTLDLHFQAVRHTIAAYLVIGPEGPVLVETGPGSTLQNLQAQLSQHGLAPQDIGHVLVTHIHLDHAGAAGWWGQQGAQIYVHHIGAPHLINPSRLLASAARIYGDKMDRLWGPMLPTPAEKVTAVYDGDIIHACGLEFIALDTPGHARHHHVYQLGNVAFSGDAAGVQLPDSALIDLPAPPPEFELEVWQQTIDRLVDAKFTTLYPTHFGPLPAVQDHLQRFKMLLSDAANFVRVRMEAGVDRDELVDQYTQWRQEHARTLGVPLAVFHRYETANPLYMSVDGMMRYWRQRKRREQIIS